MGFLNSCYNGNVQELIRSNDLTLTSVVVKNGKTIEDEQDLAIEKKLEQQNDAKIPKATLKLESTDFGI